MAGAYNEQGHPLSKRARKSTMVDEDDDDITEFEGRDTNNRASVFRTARDQHVSSIKVFCSLISLSILPKIF